MKFNVIGYYLKEGFRNLFKNKKSTFASFVTMVSTLFMFGIFILITVNTQDIIKKLEHDQGMQVFINANTSKDDMDKLGKEITAIEGVTTATFKSNQEALDDLKKMFKENPSIIEGFSDDPDFLPNSYIVKVKDLEKLSAIEGEIEKLPNVNKIRNQQSIISAIVAASKVINTFTGVITVILVIVSVLIISNTIKLTVFARRKEISIMKYVGATNSFVEGPFVIEGMLIGIFSTIIVIAILAVCYSALSVGFAKAITDTTMKYGEQATAFTLVNFVTVLPQIAGIFLALSMGLRNNRKYNIYEEIFGGIDMKKNKEMVESLLKLFAGILVGIIVLTLTVYATTNKLTEQKKEVEQKIKEQENTKQVLHAQASNLSNEISKINNELTEKEEKLNNINIQIDNLQTEIKNTEKLIEEKKKRHETATETFKKRLKSIYMNGDMQYLEILLSSVNVTDFVSNYNMLREITRLDKELVTELTDEKQKITLYSQELETKKKLIAEKRTEQEKAKKETEAVKSRRQEALKKVSDEEKKTLENIDALKAEQAKVEREIAAAILRARREQEARIAAMRKRQQQQRANSGKTNGGSSSSTSNYNPSNAKFQWPLPGYSITTEFMGYPGHTGADLSTHGGNPGIQAIADGIVLISEDLRGNQNGGYRSFGRYIVIYHPAEDVYSLYAHMSERYATKGQEVKRGQIIGRVGSTGNSTGNHLHLEIHPGSYRNPVNPRRYF